MIYESKDVTKDFSLRADVVVVGSGAGGAAAAKELAEKGVDVILLEEGGYYRNKDFNQREEDMMPLLYADSGFSGTKDFSVVVQYGKCMGGSTAHNIGLCVHPERSILKRWKEEYGVRNLSYEEFLPFIQKVEGTLPVSQIDEKDMNANNLLLRKGTEALGFHGLIPHHNRKGCIGAGFCEIGCTYEALRSTLVTYVPMADKLGAKIYSDCRVEKILMRGGEAFGVEGTVIDRKTKSVKAHFSVRANIVILSCGAVATPALLIKNSLREVSPRIGRTLHLHPYIPVAAIFHDDIFAWRGVPQTYYIDEFAQFKKTGYGGYVIISGFAHPGAFASMMPGSGKFHFSLMKEYPRMAACGAMVHDETKGDVSVSSNGKPVISYFPEGEDKKYLMHGIKTMAKIYFAAGAKKVILPYAKPEIIERESELSVVDEHGIVPHDILMASVHPQSSCPMGENPESSVVNSYGEMHAVKNLFVCDTSLYSTSLGTPPQITCMSLATRLADYLSRNKERFV